MWYVDGVGLVKTPRGLTLATTVSVEILDEEGVGTGVFEDVVQDVQHPRNIFTLWSKAELATIGIKPASITAVDLRYNNTGALTWDTSGAEAVGTYATTAKDVASLKTTMKVSVKSQASSSLSGSDWMQHREAEGGTAMPADWKTYRAAVRTTSNAKETEIDALADLDAVKAYENHPVTYTRLTGTTDESGVTTYGAPNIISNTTVNKVSWSDEGDHADSWPTAPDHSADPSFVSVANT